MLCSAWLSALCFVRLLFLWLSFQSLVSVVVVFLFSFFSVLMSVFMASLCSSPVFYCLSFGVWFCFGDNQCQAIQFVVGQPLRPCEVMCPMFMQRELYPNSVDSTEEGSTVVDRLDPSHRNPEAL